MVKIRHARIRSRAIAFLVDMMIIFALILGFVITAIFFTAFFTTLLLSSANVTLIKEFIVVFITPLMFLFLFWGYFTYFESKTGQTPGKKMLGIRVVTEDAKGPPSVWHAFIRNLLRIIDGQLLYLIGVLLIWFSKKNQRLGDMLAHTIVVKA